MAQIEAMDAELEAAARAHAATVSELEVAHTQMNEEVARAAASTGVQLSRTGRSEAPPEDF